MGSEISVTSCKVLLLLLMSAASSRYFWWSEGHGFIRWLHNRMGINMKSQRGTQCFILSGGGGSPGIPPNILRLIK